MYDMLAENIEQTPDYPKARTTALRVLQDNHVVRPPVIPREMAESYGLRVEVMELPSDLMRVAGFIDFNQSKIFINSADHYNRQAFTIAHELGHFLMHKDLFEKHPQRYKVLLRMPLGSENDAIEQEANAFAAELLVPLKMIRRYRQYATEDDLAKLFAVSPEVIRYRLKFAGRTSVSA
jgi:Zn-dependent peptidase ImmA (M78 family)